MSLHFAALSYTVETYGCWQGATPKGQNEGIQSISTRRQKSFCVLERLAEPITSRTWEFSERDCDTRTISTPPSGTRTGLRPLPGNGMQDALRVCKRGGMARITLPEKIIDAEGLARQFANNNL